MFTRSYRLMWLVLAGLTAILYFAGYLNEHISTVVGFLTATLVFVGMAILLPWSVGQQTVER